MKLKPAEVDKVLKDPGPLVAALIYGPDTGLVSERASTLGRAIAEDLNDAFRVCSLTEGDIKGDPARLSDEVAAISMLGGRRLIRIRINGDSTSKVLEEFSKNAEDNGPSGDGFVVIEAGDLGPRSSVRKLFEKSKVAAAIPCYADDAHAVERLIDQSLAKAGWRVSPEAMGYLVGHLGNDRQITRQEIEKLCLYLGQADEKSIVRLEDVEAAIGDASALTVEVLVDAVGSGDVDRVDQELGRSFESGQSAVGLLRAAINHFMRLARVAELRRQGEPLDRALGKLRPPVHFKRKRSFEFQLGVWKPPILSQAIDLLLAAEAKCKTTGNPDTLICADTFVKLSVKARSLKARR